MKSEDWAAFIVACLAVGGIMLFLGLTLAKG